MTMFYIPTTWRRNAMIIDGNLTLTAGMSSKRKTCSMKSVQDGEESDNFGVEWHKYLKFETDAQVVDGKGAGIGTAVSVVRCDAMGHRTANSTDAVVDERRSTGGSRERYHGGTAVDPTSRSSTSPCSDSRSDTVWTASSALRDEVDQQNERKTWSVLSITVSY